MEYFHSYAEYNKIPLNTINKKKEENYCEYCCIKSDIVNDLHFNSNLAAKFSPTIDFKTYFEPLFINNYA